MGKTIYFVPRYVASLKYYERLFPILIEAGYYSPQFLFLDDLGMPAYCDRRELPYRTILMVAPSSPIPFLAHLEQRLRLFRQSDAVMRERPFCVIVEPSLTDPVRIVLGAARACGVPTLALQWTIHASEAAGVPHTMRNLLQRLHARSGSLFGGFVRAVYYKLLLRVFRSLDMLSGTERFSPSAVLPDRIGVFDTVSEKYFQDRGWDPRRIHRIGNADEERARALRASFASSAAARERFLAALGFDPNERHVVVMSTIFHAGNATVCMTKEENVAYYRRIFEDIRSAWPEAEIIFKLHPREIADRSLYEGTGIKVVGLEADAEDLAVAADLYIAHPMTNVNRIARAAGVPALFVNFTPLSFLDTFAPYYGLRRIVKNRRDFREFLGRASRGEALDTYAPLPTEEANFTRRFLSLLDRLPEAG